MVIQDKVSVMNNNLLVTAVIIFFNGEKYLSEAIESVIHQTYTHWELLLCDDGSNDQSSEIAKEYEAKYPEKIKYLDHEGHINKGRSAARNLGIKKAKGDLIALLDCDDIWLPDKLKEQVELLQAHPEAGMIYGKTEVWFSWSGLSEDQDKDYVMDLGVIPDRIIDPPILFLLHLDNKVQSPTTCNVLIRKEVFHQVGYFEDDFHGMFEDLAFFSKVCLKFPVYVSGKCWAKYRQHNESICAISEKNGNSWNERYPILEWLENYLIEKNINNKEVWKGLNKQLFPYRHENLFLLFNDPKRLYNRVRRRGLSLVKNVLK
jgi:glycosyltransferase involved in cell wall biosynthesis